jgi:hypothetical protein
MHWAGQSGHRVLKDSQREQFVHEGFAKLESAFSEETAAEAHEILWRATGCDPDDKTTWDRPVVRLGDFAQEPFRRAANSARLLASFDELVGVDRWVPRESLGTFPIRFPHADDSGDCGWHIDASFPPDQENSFPGNFFEWRVNLRSKGRALLMLFLFSDVGDKDAPTRIRVGSHLRIPKLLAPMGEDGLSAMEIGIAAARETDGMQEISATGSAGTVYLCHPFLVHAAQHHRGKTPRFLAQPPLLPRVPFELERIDGDYSLVERAILFGLRERTIA